MFLYTVFLPGITLLATAIATATNTKRENIMFQDADILFHLRPLSLSCLSYSGISPEREEDFSQTSLSFLNEPRSLFLVKNRLNCIVEIETAPGREEGMFEDTDGLQPTQGEGYGPISLDIYGHAIAEWTSRHESTSATAKNAIGQLVAARNLITPGTHDEETAESFRKILEKNHTDNPSDMAYQLNIDNWKESLPDDELCGESIELLVFNCLISAGYTAKQANGFIDRDGTN